METADHERLSSMSTADLIRHALEEAKILAKAEVLHAKAEIKEELKVAKTCGIFFGVAAAFALSALALFFAAIALALPLSAPLALLLVGLVVVVLAAGLGFLGYKKLPKQALPKTQRRLKRDITLTREQLA